MGGITSAAEDVLAVGADYNPLALPFTLTGNNPSQLWGYQGNSLQNAQNSVIGGQGNVGLLGAGSYDIADPFLGAQADVVNTMRQRAQGGVTPEAQQAMNQQLANQAALIKSSGIAPALQARLVAQQQGASQGQLANQAALSQQSYLKDWAQAVGTARGGSAEIEKARSAAFASQAERQQALLKGLGSALGVMGE